MKHFVFSLCATLCCAALLGGCGGGDDSPQASVSPSPSATATPGASGRLTPPFRGKVAFISYRDAAQRAAIFVMNPDGSQVTEVPLTSSNGNPVAFRTKFSGNHFMNADGTYFVYSTLAAIAGSGSERRNYLVNADGSNLRDITGLCDPTAGSDYTELSGNLSLNTDGSRLVFTYGGVVAPAPVSSSIVTMRTDGSERTTRYTAPANTTSTLSDDPRIYSPLFAPDGETIYFIEAIREEREDGFKRLTGTLYRLTPGASTPTAVTTIATVFTNASSDFDAAFNPTISISPDGAVLVFAAEADGNAEIFSVNTDGTNRTRLTTYAARDTNPSITTDGQQIVFGSDRDGNDEIYSMNRDGSGVTRLTRDIQSDQEPATRKSQTTQGGTVR